MSAVSMIADDNFFSEPSEQALIGSVIVGGTPIFEQVATFNADDFYYPRHRWIWEAIKAVADAKQDIDNITVGDKLRQIGRLADVGGDAYLTSLLTHIPSTQHAKEYARGVKTLAVKRAVYKAGVEIQALATNHDGESADYVKEAIKLLEAIELPQVSKIWGDVVRAYAEAKITEWNDPNYKNGISWGYPVLDGIVGLIKPTQFNMVVAPTNKGKSAFIVNCIYKWLESGTRVGLVSLEMTDYEVLDRLTAIATGVYWDDLMEAPSRKKEQIEPLRQFWQRTAHKHKMHIHDRPLDVQGVKQLLYEWHRQARAPIDVLVVDYVGLLQADDKDARKSKYEALSAISSQLKTLAMDTRIPIIGVGQLNRAGFDDAKPSLTQIANSVNLAQDANKVLGIHRPADGIIGAFDVYNLKNREKPARGVWHGVMRGLQIFEIEREHEQNW